MRENATGAALLCVTGLALHRTSLFHAVEDTPPTSLLRPFACPLMRGRSVTEIRVAQHSMSALVCILLSLAVPAGALATELGRTARAEVIEDFDDGGVDLGSYPGEDLDPDEWALDATNTYEGSPFALCLTGNTWKTEAIAPIQVESDDIWEVAGYVQGSVEIQGFGLMDSANTLFYSLAGTQLLDITTWVTVYQGAFPSGKWNTYQLPIADDWLAYFGYLPRVDTLVFVCDKDGGGSGSVYFDHIVDVTDDLPVAPSVEITYAMGKVYRDARGTKSVDVQFTSTVTDPDSDSHNFLWDFGDDSTSTQQHPSHTYLVLDDHPYTVVLAVSDSTDRWGWGSCTVVVDEGPTSFPVTMNFVGDIMLARGYEESGGIIPTQGVEAIFEPTLNILGNAAEITVANMESPLTDATEHHPTKPIYFKASPENVAGLVYAGIDVVTIANNHIYDYLEPGLQQTQTVLDTSGILRSGAGMDSYEAYLPVYHTESGASIAFLASSDRTGQYNNSQPYLNAGVNKPGFAYMTAYDIGRQVDAVRGHADLIVVETHSGDEYGQVPREAIDPTELTDPYGDEDYVASAVRPTARNRAIRQAAIDAGADVVVSHHPHVVQGFEVYSGKLIAHSLGNFVFDLRYPETFPTMVLNAKADEGGFYEYTVVPGYLDDWIPQRASGALGLHILDHLARRSRELNTYLYVDRENHIGQVHLDTLTMPQQTAAFCLEAPLAELDGSWVTPPLRLARQGNISSIDSLSPSGEWEYRLGRETLWCGSCEDEGCTLWNLNSQSEWYDSTESYRGARSIRHRRYPDSGGIVVTNLEWRLKRFEDVPTTLHGVIKTRNAMGATIEARYYDSRYGSTILDEEDVGTVVSGDTAWTHVWKDLSIPDNALYYDVRSRSDCPIEGEAFSWFDDIGLIEWTEWTPPSVQPITTPNDWYYVQLRSPDSVSTITVHYTETSYGPMYGPEAAVDPSGISATVMTGQTDDVILTLSNAGNGTLHFTLEPDAPWAACAPRSGSVPPGAALATTLQFSAAALDTGSYQGVVTARTDDPHSPELMIPMVLDVEPLAVVDLTISVAGDTVHLSWSPLAQATGYGVYRATSQAGPWESVGSTSVATFDDPGACGTLPHAYYRVTVLTPDPEGRQPREQQKPPHDSARAGTNLR